VCRWRLSWNPFLVGTKGWLYSLIPYSKMGIPYVPCQTLVGPLETTGICTHRGWPVMCGQPHTHAHTYTWYPPFQYVHGPPPGASLVPNWRSDFAKNPYPSSDMSSRGGRGEMNMNLETTSSETVHACLLSFLSSIWAQLFPSVKQGTMFLPHCLLLEIVKTSGGNSC
jgi:hypothetical protein